MAEITSIWNIHHFQLFKSCSSSFSKWEQIMVQTIFFFFGLVSFCLLLFHCCKSIHKKWFRQSCDLINKYTERISDLGIGSKELCNFRRVTSVLPRTPEPWREDNPRPTIQGKGIQSAVKWTVVHGHIF